MPMLSWFSSANAGKPGPSTDSPNELEFDEIADRVEGLHGELITAQQRCEQANAKLAQHRAEISSLQKSLKAKKDSLTYVQQSLATEQAGHVKTRKELQKLRTALMQSQDQKKSLEAQLTQEKAAHAASMEQALRWKQKAANTQFELEYVKCTTQASTEIEKTNWNSEAPLLPLPFVVVLVDGDAYRWAPELFCREQANNRMASPATFEPGALAALRIRQEVTKYLIGHASSVPVTPHIVARVFCNGQAWGGNMGRTNYGKRQMSLLGEFMLQFTGADELFDFFDAGRGKERADSKIRGNFNLYISNPHCHAIFLAVCTDNGFARMLEPYKHHPEARKKIVLVSPGYMAREIAQLGFQETIWPSVFARLNMPKDMVLQRAQEDTRRSEQASDTWGIDHAVPGSFVAALVLDMTAPWDVNDAMNRLSGGVGVRSRQRSKTDRPETEMANFDDDID